MSWGSGTDPALADARDVIERIASDIGPRRPCSAEEREAAELVAARLSALGLDARLESFRSQSTFALPYALVYALALGVSLIPRRRALLRSTMAASAAGLASLDAEFHPRSPLRLVARGRSCNVVAELEPKGPPVRTLCLMSHLDSSRSGLMFHPKVTPHLPALVGASGVAILAQGLEMLWGRFRLGKVLAGAARLIAALGAGLLVERELRGEDVPGANDNASGVAASLALAAEVAAKPLGSTRLVVLVTGSEESGVLGSQAFLDAHDTSGWLFLNFDGVGGAAALHYLRREGGALRSWEADPGLARVAEGVASGHPELGLSGTERSSGLPYDATPILARGGRAITLTAQDASIPNYHWPTDTAERIDPDVLGRALGAGREMIAAIDRGEADV